MNLDIEALKAAARAAHHPDELWLRGEEHEGKVEIRSVDGPHPYLAHVATVKRFTYGEDKGKDWGSVRAEFMLAANPAAVLALIDRVELAEQDNRALLGAMHRQTRLLDHAIEEHAANAMLIEENDRLQVRLERAEAAVENLSEQAKAAHDAAHAIGMAACTSVTDLPSAVLGLLERNGEMRREIEAAMNKTDCATGLPFRPIIPEPLMRRCERPYDGPVKPGDVFAWEPDIETARELLVVTRITKEPSFPDPYEERVFTRPIDGGKEVWNSMSRFREAVVPTLFRPWQVDVEERP